jgi:hypothetical protein
MTESKMNTRKKQLLIFPKDIPQLKEITGTNCIGIYVRTKGSGVTVETNRNYLLNTIGLKNVVSMNIEFIPVADVHEDEYLINILTITQQS